MNILLLYKVKTKFTVGYNSKTYNPFVLQRPTGMYIQKKFQ